MPPLDCPSESFRRGEEREERSRHSEMILEERKSKSHRGVLPRRQEEEEERSTKKELRQSPTEGEKEKERDLHSSLLLRGGG